MGFTPAISDQARKTIGQEIRRWHRSEQYSQAGGRAASAEARSPAPQLSRTARLTGSAIWRIIEERPAMRSSRM